MFEYRKEQFECSKCKWKGGGDRNLALSELYSIVQKGIKETENKSMRLLKIINKNKSNPRKICSVCTRMLGDN